MKTPTNTYRAHLIILCVLMSFSAQSQTVFFNTTDTGQTKSITEWGHDTAWADPVNMDNTLTHMGAAEIDVVRLNFFTDEPLTATGEIGPNSKSRIDNQLAIAAKAGDKPLALTPSTGDGTHSYYLDNQGNAIPELWVDLLEATQVYIGKSIKEVEPFNEPDYWAGQGTPQHLYDIMVLLQSSPNFQGTELVGASTLSSDAAQSWYDTIKGPTTYGSTHQLAGATDSYVNFFLNVQANGDRAYNPELHSLAEAIYGAEYGMFGGIWWGPVELPRGLFVRTCQGARLGYAENRGRFSSAAVYRAPDGELRAFAGCFERQGWLTPYRFVSSSGPVYFDGVGPVPEYTITVSQGEDAYTDIDVDSPPLVLDGKRVTIVNRVSGNVLEVEGAGTQNGNDIQERADTGGLHQRWDLVRQSSGYYRILNANSGLRAEIPNWDASDGANIVQDAPHDWPWFQAWFLQDAGNGYFYIRNHWSTKYMTGDGDNVFQWSLTGGQEQHWQIVPEAPISGTLTAHYEFEGNATDSAGSNDGTAFGGPTYTTGKIGQAIDLDGSNDYVDLPNNVHNAQDITIATWVNWDGGSAWQRIFDFGTGTTAYMFLSPMSAANTLRFAITTDSNGAEEILDTDVLPTGQWIHVAVTIQGNTGMMYIDGAPRVAGQITLNPSAIIGTGNQNNYIGRSQWSDPYFNGRIDDFRIYNYALSSDEVAALVNPGTPPAAPTGLSATAVSSSQIDLSWTASSGATSYNVKRSTTSGGPYTTVATGVTTTTYSDTGLSAGTTYYYVVSAVNSSGESANSNEASATTLAASAPNAPSNLQASAKARQRIDLTWTDNSADETKFEIERSTDNSTFTKIAEVGSNVTTYSNTGLASNVTYYYRVRACNNNGCSGYSNTASATAK